MEKKIFLKFSLKQIRIHASKSLQKLMFKTFILACIKIVTDVVYFIKYPSNSGHKFVI